MKKIRNIAALLLAGVLMAILMTGCNTPELKPLAPGMTDKTKAEQMLDIVNEVRAAHDVAPVKLDKDASDMLAAGTVGTINRMQKGTGARSGCARALFCPGLCGDRTLLENLAYLRIDRPVPCRVR